jgi:hypothetical protein
MAGSTYCGVWQQAKLGEIGYTAVVAPKKTNSEEPEVLRCPRCFNMDIVPSKPIGVIDEVRVSWGKIPKHCRYCGKRFWVRGTLRVVSAS